MQNPNCNVCQIISDKGVGMLYENEYAMIVLHKMPATSGHLLVVPKEHYPILEQIPDYLIARLFKLANKMSTMLFESLNIQGTNILVSNGIEAGQEAPHVMINIIGRVENDGLNMQWQSKQVSEEEMSTMELLLKEEGKTIGEFEGEPVLPMEIQQPEIQQKDATKSKENYLLNHIQRIP